MLDQATMATWMPYVPPRGPELKALERFFPAQTTWTGTIEANGQGPGSPPMDVIGGGVSHWIMDGLWLQSDCSQEQYVDGRCVHTWQLHLVIGWDSPTQTYRATMLDNNGFVSLLDGRIEGDRLLMLLEMRPDTAAQPLVFRFIWDASEQGVITWTNESSVGGGSWQLIERYRMLPIEDARQDPA